MHPPHFPENPARGHITTRISPATLAVMLALLLAGPVIAASVTPSPCSACSGDDHVDLTFRASVGIAETGTLAITLDQATVSGSAAAGGVLSTPDGLAIFQPETVVSGTITVTNPQSTTTAWNLFATFNASHGCDEILETCSKLSTDTNYSDWSSSPNPCWSFAGSQTSASIDYKIRVLRTDQGRATAPAAVTSVTPQTISHDSNGGWRTSPAAFSTRVPLGATSETGRFNAGSLVMEGPLSISLPSRTNLALRDPLGRLASVTVSQGPLTILRQVKSSARLADIRDASGDGFEIWMFEKGDYDETTSGNDNTYAIHNGAVPSVKYRYLPEAAATGHLGGIRMETVHRNGAGETTLYLNTSTTEYRIVRGANLETVDVASALSGLDGTPMRTDIETVNRDGVLFSRTCREFQYQSVTPTIGETTAVPFMTYEQRQVDNNQTPAVLETQISPAAGFIGKSGTITRPDGSWEIRSYYAGDETNVPSSWRGLPKRILSPWNNSPSSPDNATSSNCQCTDITYTTGLVDGSHAVANRTTSRPTRSNTRQTDPDPSSLVTLLTSAGLSSNWTPSTTDLTGTTMADAAGEDSIQATTISYLSRPAYGQTPPLLLVPWAGRAFATLDAEGNGSVTGYEAGTFVSGTGAFTAVTPANIAAATHIRTLTLALRNGGLPASGEATQRIVIEDMSGRPLREELRIGTGTTAPLATTSTTEYNDAPANAISTITRRQDGRIIEEITEVSPFSSVRIDEQGIKTTTGRDAIGRTTSVAMEGIAANGEFGLQLDRVTSIGYSGRTSTTVTGGGNLSLTKSRTEDLTGRVVSETDETGAVTLTSYPDGGRDTQTTLPGSNTRIATNTIDGLPVSVTGTAVVNEAWSYSLDEDNLVTAHTIGGTGSTRTTTIVTDPAGRMISTTTPSPAANNSTVTDTTGYATNTRRATSRSSDSGVATLLMIQPVANSSQILTGYDKDNNGNLTTYGTDRITSTRSYYANENSAWWQVTERKTYDSDSPNTAITTSTRERLSGNTGNIASSIRETLPGGGTILTEAALYRDSKSRVQTVTRSGYVRPEITVDINGLTMAHWAPDATKPTRRTFDALGRILTETTPEGSVTSTTWGSDGKISSIADHFGNTTQYTWHGPTTASAGRPDTETDPAGKTTIRTWSTRGELLSVSGTARYPVEYTYDACGDRYTMTTWRDINNTSGTNGTNGTSATTTWHHDAASGVLLEKIYQGGNRTTYTWYATGKPHTRAWQRGAVTTWAWNTYGDLTGITYTGDNDLTPDVSITELDCLGRPLTITQDGIGTEHYTWQPGTGAPASHSYASGHSFLSGKGITWSAPDPHGLPTGYTGPDDGTVSYTWLDGRLQGITSGTSAFGYDYFGDTNLVRHMTAWDSGTTGFRQTRSYDIAGRLLAASSVSLASGTQAVSRHGYQLDSLGRRTTTTQLDGSTWTWGYNDRSEVTSSHRFELVPTQNPPVVEVTPFAETYTFDDIGNRKTSTSAVLGNFIYTANALNQYGTIATGNDPANSNPTRAVVGTAPAGDVTINTTTATRINSIYFGDASATYSADPLWLDAGVSRGSQPNTETVARSVFVPAPSVTPVHDDDGNLLNDGRWTYVWDAENRLVRMETVSNTETTSHPHRKLTFAYDWTGHRLSRKVLGPSDALISDTRWLWDGWNPVAEYSGSTLSNTYVWGLDLSGTLQGAGGVGGLLAVTTHGSPSATFYPSFDGNGNITAWTKSGEAHATCQREYDAFGNVLAEQGTPPCGFGFSTKMEDPETGLLYYDLRYMQPLSGRWLSRDPIGERGGRNLYRFTRNNGIGMIDRLGLQGGAATPGEECPDEDLDPDEDVEKDPERVKGAAELFREGVEENWRREHEEPEESEPEIWPDKEASDQAKFERLQREYERAKEEYEREVKKADAKYPKLKPKGNQEHHIDPKYQGGDPKGPTVSIPAPYHQLITNAFRNLWKYGQPPPSPIRREQMKNEVYEQFPLPPLPPPPPMLP